MQPVPNLEIHVAHACNLACESCSHYSNHGHKGLLSLGAAEAWMAPWKHRLAPRNFSLLGGEPTINPDLCEFIVLARRTWPKATIRLVTNGFLIDRHPDLPRLMRDIGNSVIDLSVHHDSPAYAARMAPVLALVKDWRERFGLKINVMRSFANWTRRYHGHGKGMQPFADGQPRRSWEICQARHCSQLLDGRLFKCAPLAYLPMQDARFGLGPAWAPYLRYQPLEPGCSDEELAAFYARQDEPACGMCPAARVPLKLGDPRPQFRTVDAPAADPPTAASGATIA